MLTPKFLTYEEIMALENSQLFRTLGFPMEFSISLPLPTLRWNGPGYAYFASPARRVPGQPKVQSSPGCWWVVDARTALLKLYVPYQLLSFAPEQNWEPVQLRGGPYSSDEIDASLATLSELITLAAPFFFINQPGDPDLCQKLFDTLRIVIPEPLLPQYQALAPDFFAWLEQKG